MRAVFGWLAATSGVVLIATGHGDILVYAPLVVMAICALNGFLAAHRGAKPTLRLVGRDDRRIKTGLKLVPNRVDFDPPRST